MPREDANQTEEAASGTKASLGLPQRLLGWVAGNRLRAHLGGVACLASVGMSVTAWLVMAGPRSPEEKPTLEPA